jgi:hypothetical protein
LKSFLLSIILLFSFKDGYSQNLIPNPDFETYINCPGIPGVIHYAVPWISANDASPDYFNQCNNTSFSTPVNFSGNQIPRSGVAYSAIVTYTTTPLNFREYIEVKLTSPLVANECYHFEMFASLSEVSGFNSDDIGIYFSSTPIISPLSTTLNFIPQIANIPGNFMDASQWKMISGDYIAIGGERNIIIGNYKNNANTNKIIYNPIRAEIVVLFIDDVSLTLSPTSCILPIELLYFSARRSENNVEIIWETSSETNNDYFVIERSRDSENFIEIKKINGAGNSSTNINYKLIDENPLNGISYYRLKQVDYDGKFSYSQIIDVNFSDPEKEIRVEPNPATASTTIYFPEELNGETRFELFDSQGKNVFKKMEKEKISSYTLEIGDLENGIYFLSIENYIRQYKSMLIVK